MYLYFGKAGLCSKIPSMNLLTKGCCPKGKVALLTWLSVDKALRAEFMAEYDRPESYKSVRKRIISGIGGLKKLQFSFSQNWRHFVK